MSTEKEKFLQQIRTDSNYPFTRKFLEVFYKATCTVTILISAVTVLFWVGFLNGPGHDLFSNRDAVGFLVAILFLSFIAIILMFLKFCYQFTRLCIDIADSILQSAYDLKAVVINSKSYGSYVLTRKLLPDIDLASKKTKDA